MTASAKQSDKAIEQPVGIYRNVKLVGSGVTEKAETLGEGVSIGRGREEKAEMDECEPRLATATERQRVKRRLVIGGDAKRGSE